MSAVSAAPQLTPRQWLQRALRELRNAEQAYAQHQSKAGLLGAKRAAGMALRGALQLSPRAEYGQNYVQHVAALAEDAHAPEAVRRAAARLTQAQVQRAQLVSLRPPREQQALLQAAHDVMAHAYVLLLRAEERAAREKPERAEERAAREKPERAEERAAREKPERAEERAAREKPERAEERAAREKPERAEERAAREKPERAEERAAREKPERAEERTAREKPERAEPASEP